MAFSRTKPPYPPLVGTTKPSFAYVTIKDRMPVIVAQVVDTVYRGYMNLETNPTNQERIREAKRIVEELGRLRYEMQTDKPLRPLEPDSHPDFEHWNKVLAHELPGNTWYTASWLFSECYMYRRIYQMFAHTTHWATYDYFAESKQSTFYASHKAVGALAERILTMVKGLRASEEATTPENRELAFKELAQASLWGNRTDLSLLVNLNLADIHTIQNGNDKDVEAYILANDLPMWWKMVQLWKGERLDIVLDNAGIEVFADMVFAHWMVQAGYCTKVVFHCKAIPWFVSDTTVDDFHWVVNTCCDRFRSAGYHDFEHLSSLTQLAKQWQAYLANGTWELRADSFWTLPDPFWNLPVVAPGLHQDLRQAATVVFKGDLNYRKLMHDCDWPSTTPFSEAIGTLAENGTRLPVVALRTSKADLMVGMPKGRKEELDGLDPKWMVSGKYAVIQASLE
ncbi:Hairy/enhancer-of-split with YRPW motif protein 2 [Dispira simplex]|nr:Hairy/enhancer-of-split with YRPW motif protein 2 [Dispira simplex]